MKKSGFTLIEVITSIFIFITVSSLGISLSKFYNKSFLVIEDSAYIYEIQNLLSYGKAVCKDKNVYGKIFINREKNEIVFKENFNNIEKKVQLSNGTEIVSGDMVLFITPNGKISQGNTIKLKNKIGERSSITIGVGVDLITINKE